MARSRRKVAEVVWSPAAERDLTRIHEFFLAHSPRGASRVFARVVHAVDMLALQPEIGAIVDDVMPAGRYRHVVVSPYRVIYRLKGSEVRVMRVWDSRRDPEDLHVAHREDQDIAPE